MILRSLLVAGLIGCGTAHAGDAGRALAQRSVCLACHQVDVKRVGPSFQDIAIRYAGVEDAVGYLARSIREGSRGIWGAIPMPAQRHLDPVTTTQLAEWIMTLAPAAANNGSKSDAAQNAPALQMESPVIQRDPRTLQAEPSEAQAEPSEALAAPSERQTALPNGGGPDAGILEQGGAVSGTDSSIGATGGQ